ncbi:MAG: cupin-like domain-containing protein [Chromatiales bacterium]|jgi:lysine-specific demethylase 8/hypoxia-inducible factor 1-alpha inhibitor (HIF hydroxylase)|nr:cupin-like domain-containing protein [Pseudomonadota bacterium]MBT6276946.1 cupin-like domain-containing protein [Chromatiales bacterium]
MKSVERIDTRALTPQTFASRYCSGEGQPVVLTGAFKGLPTCSPEWLVDLLPDAPFPARLYGKDHFRQAKSTWTTYADTLQLTPSTYAQMLADRSAHDQNVYMAQVPVRDTALADIIRPYVDVMGGHTGLKAAIDLNLWWGPGGHTEPLHFDSGDGTLVQLHGKKRAVLFPPSQSKNLYPFPIRRKGIAPWFSQVYIENPDFKRFPNLATALPERMEVTLAPGEVLFIPANWWHENSSLSDDYSCSINRFWKVSQLSRLFTNRITPAIYGLSMIALAIAGKKYRPPAANETS